MNPSSEHIKITIHETQGCLVVPIQEELSKKAAQQVQRSLLEQVHGRSVKGVVIDLSGVKIIDSILWEIFSQTSKMVQMLGPRSVITGLNPGVVASIIELNLDISDLTTALNLEDALEIINQSDKPEPDEEDEDNEEYNDLEEEDEQTVDNKDV